MRRKQRLDRGMFRQAASPGKKIEYAMPAFGRHWETVKEGRTRAPKRRPHASTAGRRTPKNARGRLRVVREKETKIEE